MVAEMELLQLRTSVFGTELGTAPGLDCRATFCDIWLDVDQDALIDRLRSKGQYKQAWQGPRLFVDITYSSGWALDRAEELRLALVVAGLLDQDSRVLVTPVMEEIPDRHSSLWLRVYRCPKTPDVCMPTGL
ncbi:MAG TPA: hypothetical protein VFX89_13440 [Gammaproteobacteria bacterium]|nr:hypothetical protein [Gammaproteobacteria bacterium]